MKRLYAKTKKEISENTLWVGKGSKWGNPFRINNTLVLHIKIPVHNIWTYYGWNHSKDYHITLYRQLLDGKNRHFADQDRAEAYHFWLKEFQSYDLNDLSQYEALACEIPLNEPCHIDAIIDVLKEKK